VKGKLIFSPKRGFPARIPRSLTEEYCGETVPISEGGMLTYLKKSYILKIVKQPEGSYIF